MLTKSLPVENPPGGGVGGFSMTSMMTSVVGGTTPGGNVTEALSPSKSSWTVPSPAVPSGVSDKGTPVSTNLGSGNGPLAVMTRLVGAKVTLV